jgi:hypothetical protein
MERLAGLEPACTALEERCLNPLGHRRAITAKFWYRGRGSNSTAPLCRRGALNQRATPAFWLWWQDSNLRINWLTASRLTTWLPHKRLRETASAFGQQRIYASGHAIMFSRKTCYFFVRPRTQFLEVCVFLGRTVKASQVRRVARVSKSKLVHIILITHRDEVEAPVTSWLREAYEISDELSTKDVALKTGVRKAPHRPPKA